MTCPHSLKPGLCSSCLGAVPRIVTVSGPVVLVDGEPVRTADPAAEQRSYYARRGGAAHGRRRQG